MRPETAYSERVPMTGAEFPSRTPMRGALRGFFSMSAAHRAFRRNADLRMPAVAAPGRVRIRSERRD